jgi:hypothetical protein
MSASVNLRDAQAVSELFGAAAECMRASPYRRGSAIRLPARGRLLATGDLHDNPIHLAKIIKLAKLDRSAEHHVVLHEMIHGERLINGLDLSHRMLARVAELVLQFPMQVHPLLANHELAQMTGRGVSKGAGNSVELFVDGLEYVYGDEHQTTLDAIKAFIAAMPLALLSENGVLCAHSLPAPHAMEDFDQDVLDRELQVEDYATPSGAAHLMVWGRRHTPEQLETLASRWNVKLFCLGHEHADTGIEVIGPRLIVLNSDHERAVGLPIDLANVGSAEEMMLGAVPLSAI